MWATEQEVCGCLFEYKECESGDVAYGGGYLHGSAPVTVHTLRPREVLCDMVVTQQGMRVTSICFRTNAKKNIDCGVPQGEQFHEPQFAQSSEVREIVALQWPKSSITNHVGYDFTLGGVLRGIWRTGARSSKSGNGEAKGEAAKDSVVQSSDNETLDKTPQEPSCEKRVEPRSDSKASSSSTPDVPVQLTPHPTRNTDSLSLRWFGAEGLLKAECRLREVNGLHHMADLNNPTDPPSSQVHPLLSN